MPLTLVTPARILTIHHTDKHSDANKINTANFEPDLSKTVGFKSFCNMIFTSKPFVKLVILFLSLPTGNLIKPKKKKKIKIDDALTFFLLTSTTTSKNSEKQIY